MKTFHLAFSLWLLFGLGGVSYAQSGPLHFEHLSPSRLPHTMVWSIYQDQEGFMWFGTYNGLVKYDGATTTIWKTDPTDPDRGLRSQRIHDMLDDGQGSLWFPTEGGGLHQLEKRTGQVNVYLIDSLHADGWDVAKSVFEGEQGKLWLSTDKGLACFDSATHRYNLHPFPEASSIDFLQQDAQGSLWGVNPEGLWQFDTKKEQYTLLPLLSPAGSKLSANALYLDPRGVAWIGTDGEGIFRVDITQENAEARSYLPNLVQKKINRNGLYAADGYLWLASEQGLQRLSLKTPQVLTYRVDPSMPGSLSTNNVISLYKDRMGHLWIGMLPGVNKASLRPNTFYMHQIIPTPEPFRRDENMISSILEDHTGMVWVVSQFQDLYKFDPHTAALTQVVVNPEHTNLGNLSWKLFEDSTGRLWIGGGNKLYLYNRAKGTFSAYACEMAISSLDMDKRGKLWVGGWSEGMASFDPTTETFIYYRSNEKDATGLLPGIVRDLVVGRKGEIWISSTNGLSRMDPKTAQFTHYHPPYRTADEYVHDLTCVHEDKQGMIWAGSRNGGLNHFDPNTATFTQFTTHDGLPGNRVNSILEDAKGNLWLGTDNGLSRFSPASRTFRNFGTSDGLPTIPYFSENSAYSRKDKLMYGTYNGFAIFHPDSIIDQKASPPVVYITGFKVLEESLPVPDSVIELPYDENFLSFEFVAPNYDAPEKNQYAYQLKGIDKDWVYSGDRRFASYSDLGPGKYEFRIKAANHDGVWNEQGASFNIIIHPPWWQTGWAYGLYTLLGLGLLFGLRQYTINRERLKHELKLQRMEAEKMHEIDQMKSHFFANISHEFRTPLTLILGPLEKFLSRSSAESEDKPVYLMMQRNAQRLLDLINQLLDLSKLEAGSMRLVAKPAAIVPFLKGIILSFTSLAEKQQIQYHFQYPTYNPVVYFDADKLEKIITNLLSNAFKFTPLGGTITVSGSFLPAVPNSKSATGSAMVLLELKIEDSGPGIAKEQLTRIFDRFYQTDTSQTRAWEGSGIGLSLVRELVELHQGDILVESDSGRGASFTVRLPLPLADFEEIAITGSATKDERPITPVDNTVEQDSLRDEAEHVDSQAALPLVLVVEDNADVRAFIRNTLREYKVIEASHGVAGYRKALETIPDLILSDVMMPSMEMPSMDGVQLCQKLKAEEKTAHIPVILLTAKASGADKIEGLETGADDYILKPFQADELLVRIKNLIEGRKKLREYYSRQIRLEPKAVAITSVDGQFLQKVLLVIEEHMDDTAFGVEELGREVGMSRMQLFRKLKALTDHSPGDFIRLMRLKRAAELLTQGAGNIAEVAFRVGFQEPSYFTKCFHKHFGKTPSEFLAARTS